MFSALRPILLAALSLGFAVSANAKTTCLIFIGDGEFMKPQIETRYEENVLAVTRKWGNACKKTLYLVSSGEQAMIYDEKMNAYRTIEGFPVHGSASEQAIDAALTRFARELGAGDEFRFYLGDHGTEKGTATFTSHLTPERLRASLQRLSPQVRVTGVFDHCYGGVMQRALYDNSTGKALGCGIASSDDLTSVKSALPRGVPTTITEIARANEESQTLFSQGTWDDEYNLFTTSSDRLLYDSLNKPLYVWCPDCKNPSSLETPDWPWTSELTYASLRTEILRLQTAKIAFMKQAARSPDHARLQLHTRVEIDPARLRSAALWETMESFQTAVKKLYFKRDPDGAKRKKNAERERLYEQLVDCRKKKLALSVRGCPDGDRYLALEAELKNGVKEFANQTRFANSRLPAPDHLKVSAKTTLKDVQDAWQAEEQIMRRREAYWSRLDNFERKTRALQRILQTKDIRTARLWQALHNCEEERRL